MKNKFYVCERCGNVAELIHASGVNPVCCGERMKALVPGVTEASHEKHIPVVSENGRRVSVSVGSVIHPMSEAHSILWIQLETSKGVYRRSLLPTDAPEAVFELAEGESWTVAYAYCNLHGLWAKENSKD
ncbi:MAG: desulfoferrodoxin [Clostridia bacterium]|nr:desulfoferrodoxin [Clostridia bacterium]